MDSKAAAILFLATPILALAQTYRCPDQDGKPFFSNISCERQNRPIGGGGSTSRSGGNPTSEGSALIASLQKIANEVNPDTRSALFRQIQHRVVAYQASAAKRARDQAEVEAGVEELEKQLRDAQAADKADPQWRPGVGDSPPTAAIRSSLHRAREGADKGMERFLRLDAQYQQVTSIFESLRRF